MMMYSHSTDGANAQPSNEMPINDNGDGDEHIFTVAAGEATDEETLHDDREHADVGQHEASIAGGEIEFCERVQREDGLKDGEGQDQRRSA